MTRGIPQAFKSTRWPQVEKAQTQSLCLKECAFKIFQNHGLRLQVVLLERPWFRKGSHGYSYCCSGQKRVRCTASSIRPIKCTVVPICVGQRKHGVQWVSGQPGLCGVMWSRDMPLLHSSHSTPPPTQASIDSVHLQPCRGVDLDGAHQEGSVVAKSMISGCWTIYLNIAIIYFPSSTTFFRALLKYFVCLV